MSLGYEPLSDGTVTVPSWRASDVEDEADVIADVVRLELERCVARRSRSPARATRLTPAQRIGRNIEDALVGCGLFEVYTPTLVERVRTPTATGWLEEADVRGFCAQPC